MNTDQITGRKMEILAARRERPPESNDSQITNPLENSGLV